MTPPHPTGRTHRPGQLAAVHLRLLDDLLAHDALLTPSERRLLTKAVEQLGRIILHIEVRLGREAADD